MNLRGMEGVQLAGGFGLLGIIIFGGDILGEMGNAFRHHGEEGQGYVLGWNEAGLGVSALVTFVAFLWIVLHLKGQAKRENHN